MAGNVQGRTQTSEGGVSIILGKEKRRPCGVSPCVFRSLIAETYFALLFFIVFVIGLVFNFAFAPAPRSSLLSPERFRVAACGDSIFSIAAATMWRLIIRDSGGVTAIDYLATVGLHLPLPRPEEGVTVKPQSSASLIQFRTLRMLIPSSFAVWPRLPLFRSSASMIILNLVA